MGRRINIFYAFTAYLLFGCKVLNIFQRTVNGMIQSIIDMFSGFQPFG